MRLVPACSTATLGGGTEPGQLFAGERETPGQVCQQTNNGSALPGSGERN